MTAARRQRPIALGAALAAGLLALVCLGLLLVGHANAQRIQASAANRIEALEKQAQTDAAMATLLHQEYERQTRLSLELEAANRRLAWILLAAIALCLGATRFYTGGDTPPDSSPPLAEQPQDSNEGMTAGFRLPIAPATAPATDVDPSFIDSCVRRWGRGPESAIPLLQAIQAHYRYLPAPALHYLCESTDISPTQVAGTASFYAQFRHTPVGRHLVHICHGTACHVAGAERVTEELRRHLGIAPEQDTDPHRLFTLERVACLGCCSLAPVMSLETNTIGRLTPASAKQALESLTVPS